MQITVRLFAVHREALGTPALTLTVPDGTTAGDVWSLLVRQHPALRDLVPPTAVAVNDRVYPAEHRLADGDQVALLAPVSGGSSGGADAGGHATASGSRAASAPLLELVRDPIRTDALLDAVRHPDAGAVVLFLGTVRERSRGRHVRHLEYEAYEALARSEMARIAEHAIQRWGVRIALVHRTG
ncbi:MAG: molybdenum cofactor biosynthesis protein MoaE, partial [Armatimonadetes bacterium]|nr:molybdenum cofactor biosynthesis protein MoaE [Armatimonadota bacterium]